MRCFVTFAMQPGQAQLFSKGIWKSVYVVATATAAMTHVVPQTFYNGEYVIEPLKDGEHSGFTVKVRTHFWAPAATSGTLSMTGSWGGKASASVRIPAGDSNQTLDMTAEATEMKLWWPAGLGEQPLYNVTVTFTPASASSDRVGAALSATRRIGFKYFALVTGDDTAPGYIEKNKNADGNDNNGMFFRVNGAAFMARGANMIPMDEMEARINSTAVRIMVQSAVDGNFNTLRIWGGGVFQYDAFYDACDELGIIIYHDMQYAQQGHSPDQTDTQAAEFRHQVRRISSHVSIGLYDG
jgi:beta-galactosidase/beta-glucuronidase